MKAQYRSSLKCLPLDASSPHKDMALEAVVFPRGLLDCKMEQYSYNCGSPCTKAKSDGLGSCSVKVEISDLAEPSDKAVATEFRKKKRRRENSVKNQEEVENQRMTHIAVERNRRRLMNEYLAILRSLMPSSYAQRGDQASIVAGAINFVKELEQVFQSLEVLRRTKDGSTNAPPFSDFFTFPQYSSNSNQSVAGNGSSSDAIVAVEVKIVESHANLRVLSRRRPRQLLKMLMGLQNLRLTTLHLNLTTSIDQMVLYSFSLKVEDDCILSSVDDIATAVHEMIRTIDEECSPS